jgi:hypothetical protein
MISRINTTIRLPLSLRGFFIGAPALSFQLLVIDGWGSNEQNLSTGLITSEPYGQFAKA